MSAMNYTFEAVRLMHVIEDLKERSKNGIRSFDECTKETKDDCIWFDPNSNFYGNTKREVVSMSCVDENHHDIISTMTKEFEDIDIFAERSVGDNEELTGDYYIGIRDRMSDGLIIIEDGRSYISY